MNILYTTNDGFVGKVATGICSVFENNMDLPELTVYIIGQEISEKNKKKFRQLSQMYGRDISVIDLGNLNSYFDFNFDTLGWAPVILARLVLDKLLPETVDRVLYLDGDTVDIRGLQELWDTDLQGNILGACIEATVDKKRKKNLDMEGIPYINSGVLLIDLNKWRKECCGEKIINYYREKRGKLFAADQDVINAVLKDKIFYLPPCYNFYNIYWLYPYRVLKKMMGGDWYYSEDVFEKSMKQPVIIHFLGEERPWRKGNNHKYNLWYKKYHEKTPWKDEAEEEGWELYFKCWDLFNILMKPFPMLRYHIINHLVPVFMKWRKKQLDKENR